MNQRRRRPIRKRDGTFGYNPDVYCSKYDETTGICPDGEECPLLHRTAGDTERRYHLRYYKTSVCVHETDAKGHCTKNGPHCAFAHGVRDLRPPVHDVRELQTMNLDEHGLCAEGIMNESPLGNSVEKDRQINEDPRWNDTNYVLANYKTEACKRPPRLCRQGYACPSNHNTRDRRRSPKKFKYRSTPCPNVKHGDDWGDPSQCENGDGCPYCHTRTEQQFHPEIYKSTKCNDMVQHGYCPRGPFCAFAHVEQEMTTQRELAAASENSLAAFLSNVLPDADDPIVEKDEENATPTNHENGLDDEQESNQNGFQALPSSSKHNNAQIRQQLQAIENDPTLDNGEKLKRRQNIFLMHSLNIGSGPLSPNSFLNNFGGSPKTSATMSPNAQSFYPPGDTVESVVGSALEEDLNLGELSLSSLDRELMKNDNDNDTNSVCSSLSTGFPASSQNNQSTGSYLGATSVPVTIPSIGSSDYRSNINSLSRSLSPAGSPIGSGVPAFAPLGTPMQTQQQKQEQRLHDAAAAFLSQPNPGKFSAPGFGSELNNGISPHNSISQSPMLGSSFGNISMNGFGEVQRLKEELNVNKAKLHQWEEGIAQARAACEAWKKEAEEAKRRSKQLEDERIQAYKQRDEALNKVAQLSKDVEQLRGGPYLHALKRGSELEALPIHLLKQLQAQLILDLNMLEKLVYQQEAMKCMVCHEKSRSVAVMPCNHYVMCDNCATRSKECPYCNRQITQRSSMVLPAM